ncbi:MAG TPA: hypothetical protein PK280_00950 [Planctomycetota bacterium]|nr:hypothetical protein [Planctomycetota bacterium]
MPRLSFLAALCGAAFVAAPALAGEAAAPEKPAEAPAEKPKPKTPLALQPQMKPFLTAGAARCGTVLLVKVAAAGEVKTDEDPPAQDQAGNEAMMRAGMWWGGQLNSVLRLRCEVLEVLRGDAALKECTVLCRHFDINAARMAMIQEAREEAKKKGAAAGFNFNQEDMIKRAAPAAGETWLLVLMPDATAKPAAGEKPPHFSTGFLPVQAPAADLLGDIRKLVKSVRDFDRPPELSPDQRAAATRHIAALGSAEYAARAKASQDLMALGLAARKILEETAASSSDPEVRERCALILDDLKPIPGGKPEDWAGTAAVRKSEEKPAPAVEAVIE